IALVLTGMVNYKELNVGDPLAYVFSQLNLKWFAGIVAVSAVVAMPSVLLVFQMGQPRIWMSMSRDGLLPPKFAKVHPKYRTPSFATIVTGFVVAIPALFMNLTMVTDLCSIGTLFAFALVCAGVLVLQNKDSVEQFVKNTPQVYTPTDLVTQLSKQEIDELMHYAKTDYQLIPEDYNSDVEEMLSAVYQQSKDKYVLLIENAPISKDLKFETGFDLFKHKIPMWLFLFGMIFLCVWSFKKNLSLIP